MTNFRDELKLKGLIWEYPTHDSFADIVKVHLLTKISRMLAQTTPQPPKRQNSGVEALKNELFNVREESARLAEEFERIRFETDFSNERTRRLEATYTKMLSRAPFYSELLVEFLKSTSPGQRLLAISVLETFPNPDHLSWLAERLYPHPDTAFIRYHAAVALLVAVRTLDPSSCPFLESAVRRAKEYVSRDSDDGSSQRNEIVADAEAELKIKCQL